MRGLPPPITSATGTFSDAGFPGPATLLFPCSPREGGVQVACDGRVFVIGGIVDPIYTPTKDIYVYDPAAGGGFTLFNQLTVAREAPGTTLLGNGKIIAIGGVTDPSAYMRGCSTTFKVTNTVDLIDPDGNKVNQFTPDLPDPNWTLTAATLLDGSLIAAGGTTCGGAVSYPYLYFLQGVPID